MPAKNDVMWPRNWDGTIVWFRPDADGGVTSVFWSIPEQKWKPTDRGDAIMCSDDATEEELIAPGLNPQDFK